MISQNTFPLHFQEAFKPLKPRGDFDNQNLKNEAFKQLNFSHQNFMEQSEIASRNDKQELSVVKQLIGDCGSNDFEDHQIWRIERKYISPLFLITGDNQIQTTSPSAFKKYPDEPENAKGLIVISEFKQPLYSSPDEINDIEEDKIEVKNQSQEEKKQKQVKLSMSLKGENEIDNLIVQGINGTSDDIITSQQNMITKGKGEVEESVDTNSINNEIKENSNKYIPLPSIKKVPSSMTPNKDIVNKMCDTEITDLQTVGSIQIMLVCLLVQFGNLQLAEELYFIFQRQILRIEGTENLFEIDIFQFIAQQLKSEIYLNEIVLFGLRLPEFIPLLNLFLIVFQVRINTVRNQILSVMVKKSLSTLEIMIGNFKKRTSKHQRKKLAGNKKISIAMNKLLTIYMKKGYLENENQLLIFVVTQGLHQISQELIGYLVYTRLMPPELFISKKAIKESLLELNIPLFRRAFILRKKWVKSLFLNEKFFLHICRLIRCNETFAEGLYFMKKISQKKQRQSAPLWYTENVIELFEEVAKKQNEYQMLQVYTLSPLVSAIIISKMLFKLSLNKNPLQVQLNRLSDHYKTLSIEFRDQISDERQMKMQLFKIIFPSDKTLVQICKTEVIYNYFNEFLQHELILKLLSSKYASSHHYDVNLFATSTSYNYLTGSQKLQMPFLHYNQKFEKLEQEENLIENENEKPKTILFDFKIAQPESDLKQEIEFFKHIDPQQPQKIRSQSGYKPTYTISGPKQLLRQYRTAVRKKKTVLQKNDNPKIQNFDEDQTLQIKTHINKDNNQTQNNKVINNSINIFTDVPCVSSENLNRTNHFYSFHVFQKSLKVRNIIETTIFLVILLYSVNQFFGILDISHQYQIVDQNLVDLQYNSPSYSLYEEIQNAGKYYTPSFSINDIVEFMDTDKLLFCSKYLELLTNNITAYVDKWSPQCEKLLISNEETSTASNNFRSSLYLIYMIPASFLLRIIHSKLTHRKLMLDLNEYIDIALIILSITDWTIYLDLEDTLNSQVQAESASTLVPSLISVGDIIQNDLLYYTYCLTILLFFLFCKFFRYFSRTEQLGVFMKILGLALKQMVSFMFLFMLNIFSFGSLLYLLSSYRLDLYSTFLNSIRTLIATSLGTFDFNSTNLVESLIQVVFLYSSNVIMINLLIAILTKTYSEITERSNVEYALILYEEYRISKLDKDYSLLIAFPPPLNAFSVVLMPLLLFQKKCNINKICLRFGYTVIQLSFFLPFFFFNVLLVPFAWIYMVFSVIKYQFESISLTKMLLKKESSTSSPLEKNNSSFDKISGLKKDTSLKSSQSPPLEITKKVISPTSNQNSSNPLGLVKEGEKKKQDPSEPHTIKQIYSLKERTTLQRQASLKGQQLFKQINKVKQLETNHNFYIWSVLIWKILSWILFGLPYLFYHSIVTDTIMFLKSSCKVVENKYKFEYNWMSSPLPYRIFYLLNIKGYLVDSEYQSESVISNFHLKQFYLKFKYMTNLADQDSRTPQKKLKNYFLKLLKIYAIRKKRAKEFSDLYDEEYKKEKEKTEDIIENGHTEEMFLAAIRMKQIFYSTEFWDKEKVTSKRQAIFYKLAINPSKKHAHSVQKSFIRQLQSQNQNFSDIKQVIQNQMSVNQNPMQTSFNSLTKNSSNNQGRQFQPKRPHLQTLYEQTDAE